MNRSLTTLLVALAVTGALTGCASISKSECLSANWEDIGVRDGANGQPEEYLIEHSKACAKVHVVPDRGAWQHGREHGLERYCVPRRAYQAGEGGSGFNLDQCVNFDEERLSDAWQKGHEVNRLSGALGSIDSEISDIRKRLEQKDLEQKERENLAFRLGQLVYQRVETRQAFDVALDRARDL